MSLTMTFINTCWEFKINYILPYSTKEFTFNFTLTWLKNFY